MYALLDSGSTSSVLTKNDQLPTIKEHPKQIPDKYGHLKDIQMPQLDNLKVDALLGCDMYALIIATEIRERNTEQPIAVKSRIGWIVAGPNQNSTPTKEVYLCQTCGSLDQQPEHQTKTQRTTTTRKHSEHWRTPAATQITDDAKQDISERQLKNCQTIESTPKTI